MIGIGCIFKNTDVHKKLQDAVNFIGHALLAEKKSPTVKAVWQFLQDEGIEVDLQTVGHVYNEVLPRDDQNFQSSDEVDEFVLKNYASALNRASKLHNKKVSKELGQDKSELAAVMGILNMIIKTNTTTTETKSVHVQMQEALWKEIQRKLNLPINARPKTETEWQNLLEQALAFDKLGITDLTGKLNSMTDLFDGMQKQLEDAAARLGKTATPLALARFHAAVAALKGNAYSILLSAGEARNMVVSLMKAAGFTETLKSGKEVLDWAKLAGAVATVDDIRANVQKVMTDAGYPQRVIDAVKSALEVEFNDHKEEIIRKQLQHTNTIARQGTEDILDDAGLQQALGGQKEGEWIKTEDIENVQDLETKAEAQLSAAKYVPEVRAEVIKRLKDFFDRNYAKLISREAKEAVRDILGGQTALEWIKANGLHNEQELYDAMYPMLQQRGLSVPLVTEIMNEFNRLLDLNNRAEKDLASREAAQGRTVNTKTDIRKLAELFNLGLYDTAAHRSVLYSLLGVPDITVQDIADIERVSKAASDLFRIINEKYGDQIYFTRQFQDLQREIDRIVAKNISNKTRALKVIGVLRAFFDILLSGLLMGPFTIAENAWSGIRVGLSAIRGKVPLADMKMYKAMLFDVTLTGRPYGEEVGSFSPKELYSNMLAWKWKDGTVREKAESLLYLAHLPGRVGLLGLDSANKVFTTNQIFKNSILKALMQGRDGTPGMSKQDALRFMNQALNGQSFEDAKKQAEELINLVNASLPAHLQRRLDSNTITTLANDIVKANLTAGKILTNEIIAGAYKSAYHVAGYGLGHEANNFISKRIELFRKNIKMEEEQLVKEKDWEGLAWKRMAGLLINSFAVKFAGGATNWIWLRAQEGLGLGIVTGGVGHWNHDIDFADAKSMQKSMNNIQLARHKIGRAVLGLSVGAMAYVFMYAFTRDHDEEKKKVTELQQRIKDLSKLRGEKITEALIAYAKEKEQSTDGIDKDTSPQLKAALLLKWGDELKEAEAKTSVYKKIKSNWMLKRGFVKLAPEIMLLSYFMDTEPNEYVAAFKFVQQTAGVGSPYDADQKFTDAGKMAMNNDYGGAAGAIGSILGSSMGVPMWRAYKDWFKVGKWIAGKDVHSDFKEPASFVEGVFGGGAFEDLGIFKFDTRITVLTGIGFTKYNRFQEKGLGSMEAIKKTPDWWLTKYTDDDGKEKFILSGPEQAVARKEAEEYFKQE